MEVWQTVLISITGALGGTGVMVAVLGWLAKKLISSRIKMEFEAYKAELQLQNQLALEDVKSDAAILGQKTQIKFTKLHEKRGFVISEMHGILVDMEELAAKIADAKRKKDVFFMTDFLPELAKINLKFSDKVTRNSLYFSEDLVKSLRELAWLNFSAAITSEKEDYFGRELNEEGKARYKEVQSKLIEAKKMVETEFRNLLGVSS